MTIENLGEGHRRHQLAVRMGLLLFRLFLAGGCLQGVQGTAQVTPNPQRAHAIELYKARKCLEVLPLFEELAKDNPTDLIYQEGIGVCLMSHAAILTDDAQRQKEVTRAREALVLAKQLGDSSEVVRVLLEITPVDGKLRAFSGRDDVQAAMSEGEAAFAKREFDRSITAYQRAMMLDPHLYAAPLFIGDCYFSKQENDDAGKWFATAVAIDPDRETAYRYWGDALMVQKKLDEAHAKYIDAIIAEPYSQKPWIGLGHWAKPAGRKFTRPNIESPNKMQEGEKKGDVTITIDAGSLDRKNGSSAWLVYEITRAGWKREFANKLPQEKEYRHSLGEETEALRSVAELVKEQQKNKEIKQLDPSLRMLIELAEKDLIEAYVLFSNPDEGIMKDYIPYRTIHREQLRRYLQEYVAVDKN